MRAVAYAALGKRESAKADFAKARTLNSHIDAEMAKVHIVAPAGL